jgi:superfamily II DNA/RNA helicase
MCIAALSRVDVSIPALQAVILAPTWALVKQIGQRLADTSAGSQSGVRIGVRTGNFAGVYDEQKRPLHVIVATPGTLYGELKREEKARSYSSAASGDYDKPRLLDRLRVLFIDEAVTTCRSTPRSFLLYLTSSNHRTSFWR